MIDSFLKAVEEGMDSSKKSEKKKSEKKKPLSDEKYAEWKTKVDSLFGIAGEVALKKWVSDSTNNSGVDFSLDENGDKVAKLITGDKITVQGKDTEYLNTSALKDYLKKVYAEEDKAKK